MSENQVIDANEENQSCEPSAKYKCFRTNYDLCIKCQSVTTEGLSKPKPDSYEKYLDFVHRRAQYGEEDYQVIYQRVKDLTPHQMKTQNAQWHRTCYQSVVHVANTEASRLAYEAKQANEHRGTVVKRKVGRPSTSTIKDSLALEPVPESDLIIRSRLLRSKGEKLNSKLCFFCNEEEYTDNKGPLHQVSNVRGKDGKQSVGQKIYEIVMDSNNEVWKVKIQQALDPHDLLSIDLKYHLCCYVIYVQRGHTDSIEETA